MLLRRSNLRAHGAMKPGIRQPPTGVQDSVRAAKEQTMPNRTAPRFIVTAVSLGGVVLALLGSAVWTLIQHGGMRPMLGWTSSPARTNLIIRSVEDRRPASDFLKQGDELVTINGRQVRPPSDPATLAVTSIQRGTYSLVVRRGGALLRFELPLQLQFDLAGLTRAVSLLVVAIAFFTTGLLIGLSKPTLASLRAGSWFCIACAIHMIGVALRSFAGALSGAELYLYVVAYSISFYQYALGFHFATLFPAERRPELFRRMRLAVYVVTILLSTPRSLLNVTVASDRLCRFLFDRYGVLIGIYLDYRLIVEALFQVGTIVFVIFVLSENYRLEPSVTDRRRLRWVAAGVVAALVPITTFAIAQGLLAAGRRSVLEDFGWNVFNECVNVSFGLVPVTIAYAVLRQRLFDLDVIVRSGARYLIARSLLRGAFAVPFLIPFWILIAHRDQPLSLLIRQVSLIPVLVWAICIVISVAYFRTAAKWLDRRFFRGVPDRDALLFSLCEAAEQDSDAIGILEEATTRLADYFFPKWISTYSAENASGTMALALHVGAVNPPEALAADCTVVSNAAGQRSVMNTRCYSCDACAHCCFGDLRPVLALQILKGTKAAGWILMGEKLSEEPYTKSERMLLDAVGMQLSLVLQRAWLREAVERECRIRMEVLSRLSIESEILRECPSCGACFNGDFEHCDNDGTATILTLPIMRVIDSKYRLRRRIGKGASGIVFEADDLKLARRVAVKIMVGCLFGNPKAQRRFEREARSNAKLNHPNIVTVFDYGTVSGGTYIVMELLNGVTWRSVLLRRPKPELAEVLRWSFELLDGVEAAHAVGVLHRDLKPENTIICRGDDGRERLKLVDFGIARAIGPAAGEMTLTETDVAVGTPAYMAPEQLEGEPLDERADIYSIGVILTEAIFGFRPPQAAVGAANLDPPAAANVPQGVGLVLRRCLERDSGRRYRNISELRQELTAALSHFSCRSSAHS
jgi:eukaryotic-like serine/threonine-protein kinase